MDCVLGVFCKQPRPAEVKSRLAAETSPEWAAKVALAFLRDTLARLTPITAERVLAYSPASAEGFFRELVQDRFAVQRQEEGDLGGRMAAFFHSQLQTGAERVVLVGTDSPTLPVGFIEQAFRELASADVVLGPATDGGYYLVGCGRRLPAIFDGIAWGGNGVLAETIARLAEPSWRVALLPPWYDVDTLNDWQMLRGHVAALRRAGLDPGIPHTEPLLRQKGLGSKQ
jgi:rSAM/selenodomain-associated transferase 1